MFRYLSLIVLLVSVSACAQRPEDVARMVEFELEGYGLNVDADNLSPGEVAQLQMIMSSNRSTGTKAALLRSQLSHPNTLRGVFR